jgi:alpha-N-arabinofuranosidase
VEPFGPVLTGWHPIGNVSLALDRLHPLSGALPHSLEVTFPVNATGEVGFLNTGWWGMDVSPGKYNASFYVNSVNNTYMAKTTTFTVSLRSNLTGETFASSQIGPVHVDTFRYSELNTTLYNNASAPNGNNTFAITFDAAEVAGQTFYFSLLSLFPETFKGGSKFYRAYIRSLKWITQRSRSAIV